MKRRDVVYTIAMLSLSAIFVVALILFAMADISSNRPRFDLATFFIIGSLLIITTSLGLKSLLKIRREAEGDLADRLESYRHLWRIGGVLVAGICLAIIAKSLLVPDSYGEYGYYRGYALEEQQNILPPLYQTKAACEECHDEIVATHSKDVHRTVQCEVCHGPGLRHIDVQEGEAEAKPDEKTILLPRQQENCLSCHKRLAARPSGFPQINRDSHFATLEVTDEKTPCSGCHSPHEPLFLDVNLSKARRHPTIAQCENCHRQPVGMDSPRPENHPTLFACNYCHPSLASDFKDRAHGQFDCRTCHQFYVESETAGRIVKHRDPQFCLLCHKQRPFVACDEKPCIKWPEHRNEVSDNPEDNNKVCADCHREAFHLAFSSNNQLPPEEQP